MTNRGTAFTVQERRYLGLVGLMPSEVTPIGNQVRRVYQQYQSARTPFAKNNYLASVRDRNEVLFYRLLADHLEEMLPIIYTPTIGEVIERFSVEYHRPRGVFVSIDRPEDIEQSLLDHGLGPKPHDATAPFTPSSRHDAPYPFDVIVPGREGDLSERFDGEDAPHVDVTPRATCSQATRRCRPRTRGLRADRSATAPR